MPTVVGVAVAIQKRPTAAVAVLEGDFGSPTVREVFSVTTSASDTAEQIHDLASGVRNRLRGLKPEVVLVRRADRPPRPSNQEGPRLRLLVEGGIAAASSDVVERTTVMSGRDAASACGTTKAKLDAKASALVDDEYVSAAGAALAALC